MKQTLPLITAGITLTALLCACKQHPNGLQPTALQNYVAQVDATALLAQQDTAKQQHHLSKRGTIAITHTLHTKPQAINNNLYNGDGQLVFSGGPINQEQLVRLNPNGSTSVVEDFLSDPQGNYIAFTPKAIYHINKKTGQNIKITRAMLSHQE